MRFLTLAVLLLGFVVSGYGSETSEKEAIEAIERLGGRYDASMGSVKFTFGSKITDDRLVHLKWLTNLTELSLHSTQITDDGLAELKQSLPKCYIGSRSN